MNQQPRPEAKENLERLLIEASDKLDEARLFAFAWDIGNPQAYALREAIRQARAALRSALHDLCSLD